MALTASGANFTPSFSPDGSKIAFTSTRDGNAEIYVMDANGSNQMRLTNNTSPDYDPSWSPDGTRLVFTHQAADHELPDIYVMNANGRGVTNLTNTAAHSEVLAAWSPDGNRVVYVSDGDGNHEIYVRLADGSGTPQNITNDPANDTQPDWQPLPSGAGVADDVRQLMAAVEQLQVAKGMKTSLLAALRDVLAALEAGNSGLACSGLQDFIGKVSAQSGKKIPAASAAALIQAATSIREDLGCETGTLCYPDLPAPQLGLLSTTVDELATIVRFEFVVPNYASFPDQLFMPAPDLAPCGLNTSSSRTWVDIVDGTGNHLSVSAGSGRRPTSTACGCRQQSRSGPPRSPSG